MSRNPFVKQEAMRMLAKQDRDVKIQGARKLVIIFNPLGIHNSDLIENVRLVRQWKLKEAEEFLRPLLKKMFFFRGKELKKEIMVTLQKLG
jgi:hypothetical protein